MTSELHLVKIGLRADRLARVAQNLRVGVRDLDDGYVAHVVLRGLWQGRAPAPFVLKSAGRMVEVWGYAPVDANGLIDHVLSFSDPSFLTAVDDPQSIASRRIPEFEAGRRLGFSLRACPVVRLSKARNGHSAGAEVDAFLARCFVANGQDVSREDVYRDWLLRMLNDHEKTGVSATRIRVMGISRERLTRRTQGTQRSPIRIERPDVSFEGDLVVSDGSRFLQYLAHGTGRHRAFGFGALMVGPPSSER